MSLVSKIESILFVSGEPITAKKLATALGKKKKEVESALDELEKRHNNNSSGINLMRAGDSFQLVSSSANHDVVSNFIKSDLSASLTEPAIETLSIIAYRGPVSKPELEQIRGVNCSLILRNLLLRGLVSEEKDKNLGLSRYQVSIDFVRHLGLNNVKELPNYEKLHKHQSLTEVLESMDEKKEQKEN